MKRKQPALFKLLLLITLSALFLAACSSAKNDTANSADDKKKETKQETKLEVSEENPLVVDKKNKVLKVYATVNGKYLVSPTRHGLTGLKVNTGIKQC